jgi:hypothetical protein
MNGENMRRRGESARDAPSSPAAPVPSVVVFLAGVAPFSEQAMPLKRLERDHRVTTWRGVEFWMVDEADSLVFCRISHEALRYQAKRTHLEGADDKGLKPTKSFLSPLGRVLPW